MQGGRRRATPCPQDATGKTPFPSKKLDWRVNRIVDDAGSNILPEPLPMLTEAGHADAWHRVTAPGGYEWWYFDAESEDGRTRFVVIFLEGFVFHAGYLRRYAKYLRHPTRVPPPTANDYPCMYFVVYRDGKLAHQFMTQYRPDQFRADPNHPDVAIGPNTMRLNEAGNYELSLSGHPWHLTGRGPQTRYDRTLSATLTFEPTFRHEPMQRRFLSREMTGADHHWVLAAPHCRVSGRIATGDDETIEFSGLGYHDHNYGTAPLGPGLSRWTWGRVLLGDGTLGFHVAEPRNPSLPKELHAFEATSDGERDFTEKLREQSTWDWSRTSPLVLRYPRTIRFGEWLSLSNPVLIDSAPFYMRVAYETSAGIPAFCEIAHPHRLRWPILGRMIEMSIDKSALSSREVV